MTTNRTKILASTVLAGALAGTTFFAVARADDKQKTPGGKTTTQRPDQGDVDKPRPTPTTDTADPQRIPMREGQRPEPIKTVTDRRQVEELLRTWPERPAAVAREMIDEYGTPTEATPSMLVWRENGPWKKTVVHRDEVQHDFPRPHTDIVAQYVEMRVPVDRIDDIVAFDGSIHVHRTEGLVGSHCDSEAMNYLALNIAQQIAAKKLNTKQARAAYTKHVTAVMKGEAPELTTTLKFTPDEEITADPDKATIKIGPETTPAPTTPAPTSPTSPDDTTQPPTTPGQPTPGSPNQPLKPTETPRPKL
jgi:hypothetical protein